MDESAITVRYAKAVFSLGKENNQLSALKKDAERIAAVCSQSDDFNWFLKNPVVKISEKIRIIHLIFMEKVSELSLNFLTLMTQNKREEFIPAVCRNILSLIREEKNIKTAVLTTAVQVDESLLQKAEKMLEEELGTEVELTSRINPHIIGGVVLQIDGKQYDDSIATQLKKLKQEFLKTQV